MVELIVGNKGKGKTKHLLDKVNKAVKTASGNIVYLDKNTDNMFELNNKIRLINVSQYLVDNPGEFVGFVSGILSQDNDLEQIYIDCLLILAGSDEPDPIFDALRKIDKLSEKFDVDFTVVISYEEKAFPEDLKEKIILAL
ncbi:MAG: twitching motility protein PilT [Acetatifactor sp.]|nr:twitching motility protein PilT [Acetatifactor sp.]